MRPSTGFLTLIVAALVPFGTAPAQGLKADRDAPVQVEADHMTYDDARQLNVFTGRVQMVRGALTVLADRIVLRQDEAGNQFATATGKPARFRQVRAAEGDAIEGKALTLEYDSRGEVLTLKDEASMRRVEGERVINEVFGRQIVYRGSTDFFTVSGGDRRDATPANPGGRVRVVIQPRSEGEPAAASGGASAAPALRETPALEGRTPPARASGR